MQKQTPYREWILDRLGRKCSRCGFSDTRALQIDHIDGGGNKGEKASGGLGYYRLVLDELDAGIKNKYQILCANCNSIKKIENKEARGANQHRAKAVRKARNPSEKPIPYEGPYEEFFSELFRG